jgi:hypothetical protein
MESTATTAKVIGIDPGKEGAIAILSVDQNLNMNLELHTMPLDPVGQIDPVKIWGILHQHLDAKAVVHEDVHSIFGASAATNFQFGRNTGISYAVLSMMQKHTSLVQPKEWQKEIHKILPSKFVVEVKDKEGPKGKKAKALSLAAAKQLFPNQSFLPTPKSKVAHDGLVDAALIAYYCYLKIKQ